MLESNTLKICIPLNWKNLNKMHGFLDFSQTTKIKPRSQQPKQTHNKLEGLNSNKMSSNLKNII